MNGKVYKITNNVTGESYIGKTIRTIEERFEEHCHGTERDDGRRSRLQKAMAEYGYRNFSIELLMEGIKTQERLDEVETGYMQVYGTLREYNAVKSYTGESREKGPAEERFTVSYHRDLSYESFSYLSCSEYNFLMGLLGHLYKTGSEGVTIELTEAIKLSGGIVRSPKELKRLINSMKLKMREYSTLENDLFSVLHFDDDSYKVKVKMKVEWLYLVNSTQGSRFITFDYDNFLSLSTVYSKSLFRILSLSFSIGHYQIEANELRSLFGCPESYNTGRFHSNILDKSIEELGSYFKDLSVEKVLKGNKVIRYEFTFTKS